MDDCAAVAWIEEKDVVTVHSRNVDVRLFGVGSNRGLFWPYCCV
jgi:hypothetical protein